MWFLVIGIALLLLKYAGWSAIESWPWWWTLVPFGLAMVWWTWADWSGYTKRQKFEQIEARRTKRLEKLKRALGIGIRPPSKPSK